MKKLLAGLLIYLMAVTPVWTQATLVPNAKQQFFDNVGDPLAGGSVTMYVPNSTNKKTTWQDAAQTINNANPIILDSAGRAVIFGQGNYQQLLKASSGTTIWNAFTSALGSASPSGATGTDTAPVGTVMPYSGFSIPTNWALAYGQAVSRTTFSALKTALTIVDTAVSCTNGSATLTGFASTAMMRIGAPIEATCFTTGVTIATIVSATSITISAMASATNTVTTTVFPWGNGDGASTFNVPDLRGRTFAGADAMGGTAAARLTTTYYGASAAAPGVSGGSQSATLSVDNLPAHNHGGVTGSSTIGAPVFPIFTTIAGGSSTHVLAPDGAGAVSSGSVALTGTHSHTISSQGSFTPFAIIQPTMTVNYIIKMAPNTTGAGGVVSIGGMFGDIVCDGSFLCASQTIGLATQLTGTVLGNIGATALSPVGITFTQWMDAVCSLTQGSIIYRSASTWTCLSPGTSGQGLQTGGAGSNPSWATIPGTGTVSSVALALPASAFTVTGSPVTSSGTLTGSFTTQAANLIFAGPSGGAAAVPTFRSLVGADIPAGFTLSTLALGGCTLGTDTFCVQGTSSFSSTINVAGALTAAGISYPTVGRSGGVAYFSNSTTIASSQPLTANQLVIGGGAGSAPATLGALGTGTTVLHGNSGGAPFFAPVSLTADIVGIAALANGGTNAALTASLGGVIYSTASAFAVLSGTATASFPLLSGSSAAPTWATIQYPTSATSGGIPFFSSATAISSSAALSPNSFVLGGGAGTTPTTTANAIMSTPGNLILGQVGSVAGKVTLSGSTASFVTLQAPASLTPGTIFQVPDDNGTGGFVLTTNGSGVTSWTSPSSGGTVTSVAAGTGMSFSTITATGSVAIDKASAANFAAGTSNKTLTTDIAVSAAAPLTLTAAATITPDLNTGFNFVLIPTSAFTIANPSNISGKDGRSFCLKTIQAATPFTVTWGSFYQAPGGSSTASLTASAGAKDMFCFMIWSANEIFLLASKNFSH